MRKNNQVESRVTWTTNITLFRIILTPTARVWSHCLFFELFLHPFVILSIEVLPFRYPCTKIETLKLDEIFLIQRIQILKTKQESVGTEVFQYQFF